MNKNNKLEDSFSDRFGSKSINNEGWNEPSDGVWRKIEKDIYPERKKKFGIILFLLISLLILSVISAGYLYFQNQKLKQVITESADETHIVATNFELDQPTILSTVAAENEIEEDKSNQTEPLEIITTKQPATNNSKPKSEIFKSQNIPRSENVNTKTNILVPSEKLNLTDKVKEGSISKNVNSNIFENSIGSELDNSSERSIVPVIEKEVIDIANIDLRSMNLSHKRQKIVAPEMIRIVKEKKFRRPFISIMPNVAVGILKTSGNQETALTELIDKEYGNSGVGLDFLYTTPISNSFDFSIGMGIESSNFSTEYDITLAYQSEDETINGENAYVDFEHSLPTAFGNTDTALRLSRTRTTSILDESDVELDFNTNHNFVSIALPIGLNYRFGGRKSFFNAGFKVRPSYILSASSSIKSVYSHHSSIDAVNNESISSYSGIRDFNLSLGFDIGYHLFISDKSGIQMNIGVQDYLFDFYQANDFSSSVQKVGVSIGYFYSI